MSRQSRLKQAARNAPSPASPAASRSAPWLWPLLAAVTGGIYLLVYFDPGFLWWVGVQHYDVWFADIFALLASNDAVAAGLNPYLPNPLDVFHRPHVYSHWWLGLNSIGLTRADITWLGPLVVILFWACALYFLRPRSRGQFFFYLSVLLCSPLFLALDRANNDLVIFILLTPVVPLMLNAKPGPRMFAMVPIALAAGLKYYPAVAGLVLLASPRQEVRYRVLIGALLLLGVGLSVAPDLAIFGPLAPKPTGWMSFGALTAFNQLDWTGRVPTLICLAAGAALFIWGWLSPRLSGWSPTDAQRADWLRFVIGAALLSGCFFTSANFAYRWVFALWLLPFLWTLAHDEVAPSSARSLARAAQWLLLACLWLDTIFTWIAISSRGHVQPESIRALVKWSLVAEQPVTWALFGCLAFFLARFTREGVEHLRAPGAGS